MRLKIPEKYEFSKNGAVSPTNVITAHKCHTNHKFNNFNHRCCNFLVQVGSRRVIQVGGVLLLILGILGKLGAMFITIPDPIVGGVLMVMFGMITAVGISNLQFVQLNNTRNLFVIGFSIMFGMALPHWMELYPGAIDTG